MSVYPVVIWPFTLDPRVATSCPCVFGTSYEPLVTTEETSAPVIYTTVGGASATKRDPTLYMKFLIPCVEPSSQDATVPAKGWCQLTDSEHEALLNCLNRGMAVWDIVSYCVQHLGTTSRRTQQEIFIKKDLRFNTSLGLAFRAKLRACTLISWNTRCESPFGKKERKKLEDY
ncbi:hypothetical protein DSO57_1019492 [Entomophthora muscae]|uniref:Uncharacterized protein n=1 Tax=Entomophthora muscae TaxID=34485 RepID=A0ACC2U295_9FUNG|nr:hypothetical protein DSO57_1019492 [Entomophthora muscae]